MAGPVDWRRGGRHARRLPQPDHPRTQRVSDQSAASDAIPVPGPAMVGLETAELVAHRAGRRVRRARSLHLYAGAHHASSVPPFWYHSPGTFSPWHQRQVASRTAENRNFRGRSGTGGRTHSHPFCSAPGPLFAPQQPAVAFRFCPQPWRAMGKIRAECMAAHIGHRHSRRLKLASQLSRPAAAKSLGNTLFPNGCRGVHSALAAACQPPAAPVAGSAGSAGNACV